MKLKDKVILVTGASSGIGAAVAQIVASNGAKVALLARRVEKLEQVSEKLPQMGSSPLVLPADLTDRSQVKQAVEKCVEHFGQLDVVVNSAGVGYFGPIENITDDDFNRLIQTNVFSILHTLQASLPYLQKTKGMIVNISSFLGERAIPYLTALAGTKSMVNALSEGMRVELRRYGVHVLTYGPPETETEFFSATIQDPAMEQRASRRKKADPMEVAQRIVKAMMREKREVVEGSFFRVVNFFAPKLLDDLFYKSMVLKINPPE